MDMLVLKEDMKDKDGTVLLKANTPYMHKSKDTVNGKSYLVYDSEVESQEVLILIN